MDDNQLLLQPAIIDSHLQLQSGWEVKTGPEIGGPSPFIPPDSFTITKPKFPQISSALVMGIAGKGYTCGMAALHRPLLHNSGRLSLLFSIACDTMALNLIQAIEVDTRISVNGWNYNFSSQLNYQRGGMLQISDRNGKWVDTAFVPSPTGALIPGELYQCRYDYQWDIARRTYSMIGGHWGSYNFMIPSSMQNLPATLMNWEDSASLQVQLDLGVNGGSFAVAVDSLAYVWS